MSRALRLHRTAAILTIVYLGCALLLLPAYGPTWDATLGEYGGGQRLLAYLETGDSAFLDVAASEPRLELKQPHPAFPSGGFGLHQISTLNSLASAVTNRVFWQELGWLDAMPAHHLAISLFVAALLYVLAVATSARAGPLAAASAAALLLTCPRFFAHQFNNLKDVPVACLYALALFATFVAMRSRKLLPWGVAGAVTGLTLASKANALFLPFHVLLVFGICRVIPATKNKLKVSPRGLGTATLGFLFAFVAASPDVWQAPIDAVLTRFGTIMEVGKQGGSAISSHGVEHVLWTTPLSVLALALLGPFHQKLKPEERVLLVAGALFPIGRTLLPGMVNFDGVRHFLEFFPFVGAAAGLGLAQTIQWTAAQRDAKWLRPSVLTLALAPSVWATASTHPNGVCYFNVLVGGLGGAQEREIPDATDYWANSYWQGLDWLNENAGQGDTILVPIAGFVARAAAPVKLREDLTVLEDGDLSFGRTTWVMYITRPGAYGPFVRVADRTLEPTHTIEVQGGTILKVLRLDPKDTFARDAFEVWRKRFDAGAAHAALGRWLAAHPDRAQEFALLLNALRTENADAALSRLREIWPEELRDVFDAIVWHAKTK